MDKGRHTDRATENLAEAEKKSKTYRYDEQAREVGRESGLETIESIEFDGGGNETSRKFRKSESGLETIEFDHDGNEISRKYEPDAIARR